MRYNSQFPKKKMKNTPGYNFERCLVHTVVEIAEKKFKNHSTFARYVWSGPSAVTRWRQIRNISGKRPQSLTIADAFDLANAVGQELPSLCFIVDQKIKGGWAWRDFDKYSEDNQS
ncbi:MAG: hypothetical protein WC124_00065 [Desulfoplanes sp.]